MDWLAASRLHGIAKHYAHVLPDYLRNAYAASDFYTRGQIDHAVKALGLPQEYIGLAYAAYLPEAAFEETHATDGLRGSAKRVPSPSSGARAICGLEPAQIDHSRRALSHLRRSLDQRRLASRPRGPLDRDTPRPRWDGRRFVAVFLSAASSARRPQPTASSGDSSASSGMRQ